MSTIKWGTPVSYFFSILICFNCYISLLILSLFWFPFILYPCFHLASSALVQSFKKHLSLYFLPSKMCFPVPFLYLVIFFLKNSHFSPCFRLALCRAVLYWFAGDLWALPSAWEETYGLLVSFVMCVFPGPLWGFFDFPHSWMFLNVLFFQIVSCKHFFEGLRRSIVCLHP